ncbi:MAG: 16S rRNA (guanine(966)-N(2))-methyltransferase RsmD [Propionibacteriales bacterium]|nr:16S rRNA (guanine(966)-N(2))-methyltransferase RsmD [Propionibacteriales bacterium]
MTRIIAGRARGRRLHTAPGDNTRPTTDRVREAVFSALESALGGWSGVRFLDLYAGVGAVGLEAVSRGAAGATLVERDRRVVGVARRNAELLGFDGVRVVTARVERLVGKAEPSGQGYDVVFLDPPYSLSNDALTDVLRDLLRHGWLASEARVVVERATRDSEPDWPVGMLRDRLKRYGETSVWYVRLT